MAGTRGERHGASRCVRRWSGDRAPRALSKLPMLTVRQVAACFRVSKQAVHGWLKAGRLRFRRSRRDGVRRIPRTELVRFARQRVKGKGVKSRDQG
jgi:excisionase family DNA binding protein